MKSSLVQKFIRHLIVVILMPALGSAATFPPQLLCESQKLTHPEPAPNDEFGKQIDIHGDTLVVSDHVQDVGVFNEAGSANLMEIGEIFIKN